MQTILIALGALLIGILITYFLIKNKKEIPKEDTSLSLLLQQMNELTKTVDTKLGESNRQMTDTIRHQTQESQQVIRDITERLTRLDETNKQVMSFTDQLRNLQDILKNPKQRGILGEYYLETLLKNCLPPGSYQMQYDLGLNDEGSKLIPDAVVFVKDKIIPIDSKFSLENYNRITETHDQNEKDRLEKVFVNDLKLRITETSKYIRPEKGTLDFAFMFIPHEAIYYDLLINKIGAIEENTENLIQRAANKYKVIIVSPTSFLAYLQTVLQGLKALQIEESAKEIRGQVEMLGRHLGAYDKYFKAVGKNLGTTVNQYMLAQSELKKIDKDVLKITGEAVSIEAIAIDKPSEE